MRPESDSPNIALVVDDDPATLDFVIAALEECGMTVLVARDGRSALTLAGRVSPDVILLDAMMPGLDGFETCRRLKAPPLAVDAPVIFMTGLTEPEHILQGLESGAVDYIIKPLQVDELIARMTIHIMNSKLIRSARAALDVSGPAILAFTAAGRLLWGSPRAMEMVGDRIARDGQAPADMVEWLGDATNRPLSDVNVRQIGDHELTVVGFGSANEILIKAAPARRTGRRPTLISTPMSCRATTGPR